MLDFTQRKFNSLRYETQHEHCAALLRRLYECVITGNRCDNEDIALYRQLAAWMQYDELIEISPESISDRYHRHLKEAKVCKKEHHLLPQVKKGDRELAMEPWPIAIYLDNIRSAHNVGSMIRTTEALSLGSIYFSDKTPFIDHKQVQNTSMGAYQWVSCHRETALENLIQPIIALETTDNALPLHEFTFPPSFTLVVGNEEYGCSESTLRCAHYYIHIPMRGRKNSLNVANAFAIVAGEIYKQRMMLS